jgi:FlaA1/EpsC-like NDP-sugar epimerase
LNVTEIFGEVRRGPTRWGLQHVRRKNAGSFDFHFHPEPESNISRIPISLGDRTAGKTASIRAISNERASSKPSLAATSTIIVATSLATGLLYASASGQSVRFGNLWASGLLIALFFCSTLRLCEEHQPLKTSNIFDRARAALASWLMSFALFLIIAFAFKIGAEFSRGAVISFFLAGLVTVTASHVHVPIILARLQRPGAFSGRDIILVGAYGDASFQRVVDGFRQNDCPRLHVVEFNATCGNVEWPQERKTLLDRIIRLAHRLGPGEIYLATSQIRPSRAESILRVLSLVPRAVMVIPD